MSDLAMFRQLDSSSQSIDPQDRRFRYDLLLMGKALGVLVRIAWVAICTMALVNAHKGYRGPFDWEMEEGLAFQMLALSFPSSIVVAVGLVLMGAVLGLFGLALPSSSKVEMTATWFLFVVAGYTQWFILLPSFLKRQKRSAETQ